MMNYAIFSQGKRRPLDLISMSSRPLMALGTIITLRPRCYTKNQEEASHEIGEKARSTAEEFTRQAKEKTESIKETAKEIWEDAKEAAVGETQSEKEKFKEKVEKGNYDKIGRDD